ncbi:MAG TPA: Flp family type IVb pilin [Planctomycetota bacterium]|nr:Flp family type IVb pilin [Planctomycetota bacterium]
MVPPRGKPDMLPKPGAQNGQGITEYCLIIVLASIALVTALGVFGSSLADEFDAIVGVVVSL